VKASGQEARKGSPLLRSDSVVESRPSEQPSDLGDSLVRLSVFSVDGHRYGLPLSVTERVLPMVAISPLPGCPPVVLGAINLHGDVISVLDVRRRLGLPHGEYGPAASLLVARTARRIVALPVDAVHGVMEFASDSVDPPDAVIPGMEHVSGVVALADGLLLIHDLDSFFSIEEEQQLAGCLGEGQS
jgi:purine-binding chemotaxis protein CheW